MAKKIKNQKISDLIPQVKIDSKPKIIEEYTHITDDERNKLKEERDYAKIICANLGKGLICHIDNKECNCVNKTRKECKCKCHHRHLKVE